MIAIVVPFLLAVIAVLCLHIVSLRGNLAQARNQRDRNARSAMHWIAVAKHLKYNIYNFLEKTVEYKRREYRREGEGMGNACDKIEEAMAQLRKI